MNVMRSMHAISQNTFCSGAHAIDVNNDVIKTLPNIELEQSFALNYPSSGYFYLNKNNQALKERLKV